MKRLALLALSLAQPVLAQELPPYVLHAAATLVAPAPELARKVRAPDARLSAELAQRLQTQSGALADEALPLRLELSRIGGPERAVLRQLGAELEVRQGNTLYLKLAASRLPELLHRLPALRRVDLQAQLVAQGRAAEPARGIAAPKAGRGVRVGILDFGFAGYAEAGLPPPLARRSFGAGSELSSHGTGCARTIHALAPEAGLLLASVGDGRLAGEGQALAALQWLAAQGAQIINISASSHGGALDGSAPLDRLIADLARRGITVVAAAGNAARQHWQGPLTDRNGNGWVDVGGPTGDLLAFEVTRAGAVTLTVNGTPGSDVDAFLYAVGRDGHSRLLAQADAVQADAAARPLEQIVRVLDPGFYLVGVRATRLAAAGAAHVFVDGAARLLPAVAAGSVGSPGTAPAALTVGAARGGQAEAFSGRGPTDAGVAKPELLAEPLDASFQGSSAATSVVSGVAARLLAQDPGLQGEGLREALRREAHPAEGAAWGVLPVQTGAGEGRS